MKRKLVEFQFPSSGKLLPNMATTHEKALAALEFQFPSSGKLLPNMNPLYCLSCTRMSFNSLQAGNFFQTLCLTPYLGIDNAVFQFPSSGKLLPNTVVLVSLILVGCVSIPFKRETSSKLEAGWGFHNGSTVGFNSLQAGNFFQTGNTIHFQLKEVKFQFPSSGKLLPNGCCGKGSPDGDLVSIPFKRETSSKHLRGHGRRGLCPVSIPFKRETSSKLSNRRNHG